VFEDDGPDTLAEALAALTKGLADWFKKQVIKVKGGNNAQFHLAGEQRGQQAAACAERRRGKVRDASS
jgi:hypothetical protein